MEKYFSYGDLQKEFRYEFKHVDGTYHTIYVYDEHTDHTGNHLFDIGFCLSFRTNVFCCRKIVDGAPVFSVKKIVTVAYTGDVHQFDSINGFIEHIRNLPVVTAVTKLNDRE